MPVGSTGCTAGESTGDWLASVSVAAFRSELSFDAEADYTLRQRVVAVGLGRRFSERLSLRAFGGVISGGSLEGEGRRYEVLPGWLAGVEAAGRWLPVGGDPFIVTSLAIALSRARSREVGESTEETLTASDARLGLQLGTTLVGRVRPYLAARVFGGPVGFRQDGIERTGSDRHHYALGLGSSARMTSTVDVYFDAALLGERAVTWGLGATF